MVTTRRGFLTGLTVGAATGIAGCLGDDEDPAEPGGAPEPDDRPTWMTTTVEDVLTGETFAIADLEPPVLVQNFAVWCTTCDTQEDRIADLGEDRDDFEMVSINIDPNEPADTVEYHALGAGYEWYWVVPPEAVIDSMTDEFGTGFATAPNAPMVSICEAGYDPFDHGLKSQSELEAALDDC